MPEDGRDLVVGHDAPVFPREPNEHRASGVVDFADRRGREADEGLNVGQPTAIEEDVVGEAHDGQKEQNQGRRRETGRATPAHRRQPRAHAGPGHPEPPGRRGAAVAQARGDGPEPRASHAGSTRRFDVGRPRSSGFAEESHRAIGFLPHTQSPRPSVIESCGPSGQGMPPSLAPFNAALGYGDPFPGPGGCGLPASDRLSPHQPGFVPCRSSGRRLPAISARPRILDGWRVPDRDRGWVCRTSRPSDDALDRRPQVPGGPGLGSISLYLAAALRYGQRRTGREESRARRRRRHSVHSPSSGCAPTSGAFRGARGSGRIGEPWESSPYPPPSIH